MGVIPRIYWPKDVEEIRRRAKECSAAGFDEAYAACMDRISFVERKVIKTEV